MQTLQRSIYRVGVLTPVYLRHPSDGAALQIVCGFKRVLVCQHAGYADIPAFIASASELSPQQAFLRSLHDNLGCRTLNVIEKARALQRLQYDFEYSTEVLKAEFCPLLHLPPRQETLTTYGALAALDDALQEATVNGALPVETALWIGAQPPEDRQALQTLFTTLKLSSNRAREFAAAIDDLCRGEAWGAARLAQQLAIPHILADTQLSGPQKIDRVRQVLRQARYPQLSAYEQRFQEAVRQLRLPAPISLRPPPYFEGEQYQVSFTFRQRQELQHYAQRLLAAADMATLDELLALL
jgi:ParB-like chromosome segregation protein Spo0J